MSLLHIANLSAIGKTGLYSDKLKYQYQYFVNIPIKNLFIIQINIAWNKNPLISLNITSSFINILNPNNTKHKEFNVKFIDASHFLSLILPLMNSEITAKCGYSPTDPSNEIFTGDININFIANNLKQILTITPSGMSASPPKSIIKKATAYGNITGGYKNFTLNVNGGTGGSWLQNEYFTIRYTMSVNYNPNPNSPGQFQSYGSAVGTMQIYPYRFAPYWCSDIYYQHSGPGFAQLPSTIYSDSSYGYVNKTTHTVVTSVTTTIVPAETIPGYFIPGLGERPREYVPPETIPAYTVETPNYNTYYIAPNGREFFSTWSNIAGTNPFYIYGDTGILNFQMVNPSGISSSLPFTYDITIELINTGANKSAITSSGFDINF